MTDTDYWEAIGRALKCLRCLSFCGLVKFLRDGKQRIYSENPETVPPLTKMVDIHLGKYAEKLSRCKELER